MTRTILYELRSTRKAGPVCGSVAITMDGEPDALAAVERDLTAHLRAAPGCEVVPAVVENPGDVLTWEQDCVRLLAMTDDGGAGL